MELDRQVCQFAVAWTDRGNIHGGLFLYVLDRKSVSFLHDLFVPFRDVFDNVMEACILNNLFERLSKKVRAVGEAMEGCVGLDDGKGCRT